jgi:hypothetical protein
MQLIHPLGLLILPPLRSLAVVRHDSDVFEKAMLRSSFHTSRRILGGLLWDFVICACCVASFIRCSKATSHDRTMLTILLAETVKVPQMAESITEGTLKQWTKQVGDHVEQDEEVATIETDKVRPKLLGM